MRCIHDRIKAYCKECHGSQICKHDKVKATCKECGGSAYCQHDKLKQYCKECKGSGLCVHGKVKTHCKECGGSALCEHNRQKAQCKECGGCSFCKHGKRKNICKECGGSRICIHGKQKEICKECGGSAYCQHGKRKSRCKKCDGSEICEHGTRRYICKECQGNGICEHSVQKQACIICKPENACKNCLSIQVTKTSRFYPYCFRCFCVLNPDADIPRKYKLKEHYLRDFLVEQFKNTELIFDKKVDGGCSRYRPDVRIECFTHTIVIECDENQHKAGQYSCEDKRIMTIFDDLGKRPLVVIRFNPDSYKGNKGCFSLTPKTQQLQLVKTEWLKRTCKLKEIVEKYIANSPEKEVTYEYMFYDQD